MFKNRAMIKVKGLNQERAINNLSKTLKIYNYKREEQNLSQFEVELKHTKKIKQMLEQEGLEVLSISHKGFYSKIKQSFLRYGILAGIVIIILFYILQYSFVWKIEVWGVTAQEKSEVIAFIEDNTKSNLKQKINTKELEIMVKNEFDFISSISVAIIGQSLIVNLNEAVLPEEMDENQSPIISDYDGMITKINLVQGTLNVNEGDIVQKGDILVYPYIIDSQGNKRGVKPQAEIIADVWYSSIERHYDYRIEEIKTGNKLVQSEVYLGNILIYKNGKDINFGDYVTETYTKSLTNNLILPFYLKKTIYYEIETKEIIQPFDDVKDEVISKARENILLFLDKNEIILNEKYTISEAGGYHIVNYIITTSKDIGG